MADHFIGRHPFSLPIYKVGKPSLALAEQLVSEPDIIVISIRQFSQLIY